MKLKSIPEDFVVTEICSREPNGGAFAMYQLRKTSLGTLEAIADVSRTWNLGRNQMAHAGLKDRHAVTSQIVTIRNGPRANHSGRLWKLEYLGQTTTPISADDLLGNQFEITVRALSQSQADDAVQRCRGIAESGYLNYFDEQRFGSLTATGRYAGERWCKKDYAGALWLALAEYNRHDDRLERDAKAKLRTHWGNWQQAKSELPKSHRRSVVTYLCDHPTNFRKAFALVNSDLRGLLLSAFQSAIWNRMLKIAILAEFDRGRAGTVKTTSPSVTIGNCRLPFPGQDVPNVPPQLSLPSARKKAMDAVSTHFADHALREFQMTLPDMKLSFPRDRWFSRGERDVKITPENLRAEVTKDELKPTRSAVRLSFGLPRGCYATMLIKAAFAGDDGS